jgi:RNase P/RNase MRP subunit p29
LRVAARRDGNRARGSIQGHARVVADERSSEQGVAGRADDEQVETVAIGKLVKAPRG